MTIITFNYKVPINNNPFMNIGFGSSFNMMPSVFNSNPFMNGFAMMPSLFSFNPFVNRNVLPQAPVVKAPALATPVVKTPTSFGQNPVIGDTFVRRTSPVQAAKTSASTNYVPTKVNSQTFVNSNITTSKTTAAPVNHNARKSSVAYAESFIGVINNDAQGNARFSPSKYKEYYAQGKDWHWCVDFINTIVKDTYGSKVNFNKTSTVSGLKKWGQKNGSYTDVPQYNRAQYIAQNVKPGDIMLTQGHAAIVKSVNADGSFVTVDGNSNDKVKLTKRKASQDKLQGFISMEQFA